MVSVIFCHIYDVAVSEFDIKDLRFNKFSNIFFYFGDNLSSTHRQQFISHICQAQHTYIV